MNQLLLYLFFCILFIFTKENITYRDLTPQCININDVTNPVSGTQYSFQPSDYVINTEFCSRHNAKLNPNKCCRIILENDLISLDFCGIIEKSEYDDITPKIDTLKANYNEVKIDCLSKHFDFMITTLITCLIYLI